MRIRKIQVAEALANYGNNALQNRYSCKGRIIEYKETYGQHKKKQRRC